MTVGELREIIKTVSDDTKIEINSVWNEDTQELTSVGCDGFYHTTNNKIYLTPDVIALQTEKEDDEDKQLKEAIKKVIKEVAPDWEENEDFILNVTTLYYDLTLYDYDDSEMIDGFYKDAIEEAIYSSISDYEEGYVDF